MRPHLAFNWSQGGIWVVIGELSQKGPQVPKTLTGLKGRETVFSMFADFQQHFYRRWLMPDQVPAWMSEAVPRPEPDAFDCSRCFMTKPVGRTRDLGPFDPEIKCCSYHPFLPNFTLGALLLEVSEGRLSSEVFERYLAESRLTVLGAFSVKSITSVCETGKHISEKCPFLKSGMCSVHEFRPSTCATYVCRSNAGEAGLGAWRLFERQLAKFEWSLAHEAAFEIGFTKDELETVYSSTDDAKAVYARALKAAQLTSVRDWDE